MGRDSEFSITSGQRTLRGGNWAQVKQAQCELGQKARTSTGIYRRTIGLVLQWTRAREREREK